MPLTKKYKNLHVYLKKLLTAKLHAIILIKID